jgi:hypothetical protein
MTQEALKLALEALITITDAIYVNSQQEADAVYKANDAVKAIKEALAQPEEAQSALSLFQSGFIDGREKGLKEALAQTQEPVAWMYQEYRDDDQFGWRDEILFTPPPNDPIYFRNITPVYTHTPQRTWVGLTDEEKSDLWEVSRAALPRYATYAILIEAKLKEKNT